MLYKLMTYISVSGALVCSGSALYNACKLGKAYYDDRIHKNKNSKN